MMDFSRRGNRAVGWRDHPGWFGLVHQVRHDQAEVFWWAPRPQGGRSEVGVRWTPIAELVHLPPVDHGE